jgi:aminopeptidase N
VLPDAKPVGKEFKLKFTYEGGETVLAAGTGNFILMPGARETWYPNNPGTAFGDRATFDITFHYKKAYTMVGVGDRVGEDTIDGDMKTSKWSSGNVELAVAGFNFGDFKEKDVKDPDTGLTLEVYTNRELPDAVKMAQESSPTLGALNTAGMANTVLTDAQNSTRLYTAFFGKLPYDRVAMTQQPAGFFGQAWPTLVFMPYFAFFDTTFRVQLMGVSGATNGFWTEVAPHEVAHQWWGHSVGWTSYHDQWMSEGFAEFSASLFLLYTEKNLSKYTTFWDTQRKLILEASPRTMNKKPYTVGPVTQGYRLNSAKTGSVARAMIYPKGAYILQMLRMMMYDHRGGTTDKRFQETMQDLISSHFNKDISTNDFKLAVERHILPSMNIDKNGTMDWFFDEYVYGTEMPSYKLTYSLTPGADGKTVLTGKLEQSGVSKDFVMLVPIYVDFGKGWTYLGSARAVGNTVVDIQGVPLPSAPKNVTLAAYSDILAAKIDVSKQ